MSFPSDRMRDTARSAPNEVERDLARRYLAHRGEGREEPVLLEGVHGTFRIPYIDHEDRAVVLLGGGMHDHPGRAVVAQVEDMLHGVVDLAGRRRADLDDGHGKF